MRKIVVLMFCLLPFELSALVGAGGYVPFGFSTQSDKAGGKGTFDLHPTLYLNGSFNIPYLKFFLPEVGAIFYRDLKDDYSKRSYYFLGDFAYPIRSKTLIRYGVGIFITKIGGEGKAVVLNNGDGYMTFYTPSESVSTYNVTWNLGVEQALNSHYALRFEAYIYEILSSLKRDISYSFSLTYYL